MSIVMEHSGCTLVLGDMVVAILPLINAVRYHRLLLLTVIVALVDTVLTFVDVHGKCRDLSRGCIRMWVNS